MVVGELAHERDVVIIGGGPGGYNAAIRAAQLGLSVTLIEKAELGGVCLNKGCIPSKVFTHAAQKMAEISHIEEIGIKLGHVSFQLGKLQNYKTKVVTQLRQGVEALCKANRIEVICGKASFLSEDRIGVESGEAFAVYRFRHAIIATGASYVSPPSITIDHDRILNAYSIYGVEALPSHLLVYGDDYIALEVAMSFHAFGSQVSVITNDGTFGLDETVAKELQRIWKKRKIKLYRHCKVESVTSSPDAVAATLKTASGETVTAEGSHIFVACEAKANIDELGLDRLGIQRTEQGFIEINHQAQTSLSHIFAVGDVTGGPMLAVKAIKQGKVAAETIAGKQSEIDLTFLPTIVHSIPPIASVGLTEEEAKAQYEDIRVGSFPVAGNGYAGIIGQKDGVVKIISDTKHDLILGVHMIGVGAIDLISSGIIGLEMAAHEEDIKFPFYPHPSNNESLLEAVEALQAEAVHLPPAKQKGNEKKAVSR
ncbi:dihydrolipoyl dehydrogenase [Parageobacillus thermoglucosidasius]|uniref:dihydrolipoyl dehydrogenase n=1 Tax=Parageobacillus thermoglucosidasius TaxID=1426 RepID=UPI000B5682F1|nr:dihydrolipoyl dehydrogenase [Parageobacillus thermoglucosidasius]MBY6270181.1 dihydrolipoyl dehydrogenase [Parageobacillus thermoglucosidasius]MED4905635.1 dihydrolipoyl dehydrogenase [Parageobacillus thermoglucosidasius]MED4914021.1 dihydrolipoyl dehydrogenase [Parageobacillus thermoglucosidasius]MED4945744.1 dihydrolipoyl dehydrogenase [Parageobacillus thermoglucosidasius]MED4981327.1 dihydrolipoyl dehydrogenase [Parageobacillus thermoglucosidasius]